MRRIVRLAAATLAALALAAGCASPSATPPPAPSPTGSGFPVTVGSVTLAERPDRIVSLSPTLTEMLFAIGAGPQVVAADDYSNYPPEAPKTELSAFQPNAEAVAEYEPDLVVLSNDSNGIVGQLTNLAIPTLLAESAATLEDSYRQITDLGALTGRANDAELLVLRMKDDIAGLVAGVPQRGGPLRYYWELTTEHYSVTSQTFVGSLLASVGLVNIADAASKGGNAYPQLSAEYIVKEGPDVIFLANTKCCGQSAETVAKRAGWDKIPAVQNGLVVPLDDDIASRWGPRVVDLLRQVIEAVKRAPVG
jgi:iron complex transport system substrate-binding protein